MRLTELDPGWMTVDENRTGMGLSFLCPHCQTQYLGVWFANPLDGGPPAAPEFDPKPRWQRTGETFETLSLTPSIDASGHVGPKEGHWHGFITNGEIR